MDITFSTAEGRFNYRVCAVIVHGKRLLAMRDGKSPYYYLPGGRVRLHETAAEALRREAREELGVEADIVRPLWVNESFFTEDATGERFHELCVYYLVDAGGLAERGDAFALTDGANGRVNAFEWIPFERLKTEYIYPVFIRTAVERLPESLTPLTTRE